MGSYGDAKRKDIIESALPSSRRKSARDDRRAIHQAERSRIRQQLREHCGVDTERVIETVEDDGTLLEYPNHKIRDVMWDRRNGDKLGPLLRWAPHQVKHLRQEDRLSYLKAMLPDNTIGRHAAGHVEYLDEFEVPSWDDYRYRHRMLYGTDEERAARRKAEAEARHAALVADLTRIIATGNWHREFNREFKGGWAVESKKDEHGRVMYGKDGKAIFENVFRPGRTLDGLHDIEDFIKFHDSRKSWCQGKLRGIIDKFFAQREA